MGAQEELSERAQTGAPLSSPDLDHRAGETEEPPSDRFLNTKLGNRIFPIPLIASEK